VTSRERITADDIVRAHAELRRVVHRTPVVTCESIAERCGVPASGLGLKMEPLQRTGSFKIRGAYHRVAQLGPEERARGVVAASAGNHAQGVALAASLQGVRATIFMPEGASIAKIHATQRYRATVVLRGASFEDAAAAAEDHAAATGAVLVPAYDDDAVIAGQGTLGLEILEDVPDLHQVLIPVGGGGLFGGVATAIRAARPRARIVGVQASGAATAVASWRAGHLVPPEPIRTIADGVALKSPSERTFDYIRRCADDMATVDDQEIAAAMLLLLERAKTVVEPAGALTVAALLAERVRAVPGTVAVVSGGNVDIKFLSDVIERGMIRSGRYMHFFSTVPDRPGGLAALLHRIAAEQGNVINVVHNRIGVRVPFGETGVEMLVEVRDRRHLDALRDGLTAEGYGVEMLD